MKETFGDYIRKLRGEEPIRKVASALSADQSSWSKYERGDRFPPETMLPSIAEYFEVDMEQLRIRFISDKIVFELLNEDRPEDLLAVVEEKLKYLKSKRYQQAPLFK